MTHSKPLTKTRKEQGGCYHRPSQHIMDELLLKIKELLDAHCADAQASLDDLESNIETLEGYLSDVKDALSEVQAKIQ